MTVLVLGGIVIAIVVAFACSFAYRQWKAGGDDAEMFGWLLKTMVAVVLGVVVLSIAMVGLAIIDRF